jgi:ribose/xylose/arabinose/galactoside ABC-type transport system permease subunit
MTELTQPSLNDRARALASRTGGVREYGIVVATLVLAAFFSILKPQFLTFDNLTAILSAVAIVGIMAVCSTFVILTGGIDLSVGAILTLSGLAASYVLTGSAWSIAPALALGLLVGVGSGVASGAMVGVFKLPAIIVTLATMTLVRNIAHLLNHAELHSVNHPAAYIYLGGGKLLGLPFPVWVFAAVAVVAILVQTWTRLGFTVFAVGENETAARLSGLPVWQTKVVVYAISGLGAALAGMIQSSEVHTATSTYGVGVELDVIAAIVVGGTSLFGGTGSVQRSVLGVLLIGVINNGLTFLNVPAAYFQIVKGLIIIGALALDYRLRSDR